MRFTLKGLNLSKVGKVFPPSKNAKAKNVACGFNEIGYLNSMVYFATIGSPPAEDID